MIYKNGEKVQSIFIGGEKVAKMYKLGELIFSSGIPCYGFLTYNDGLVDQTVPIVEAADYAKLFMGSELQSAPTIAFTFGDVLRNNVKAWEFNTSSSNSFVTTSIAANFFRAFPSLNCDITIPDWVTNIGSDFISNGAGNSWGVNMTFSGTVVMGSGTTSIGAGFMQNNELCNPTIYLQNVTTLGEYFMYYCKLFNHATDFSKVVSIGIYFLGNCSAFNKAITLTAIQTIGNYFCDYCVALNSIVTLGSNLATVSGGFMFSCKAFNKSLVLPVNSTFSSSILDNPVRGEMSFDQTLTISAGVSIAGVVLYGVKTTTFAIICNTDVTNLSYADHSFTFESSARTAYVTGSTAAAFLTKFPNGTFDYCYRNLV